MPLVNDREEQREVLTAFHRVLGQELHNLRERPEILWQQMYNRLQWANNEEGDRPVSQVIAPEFQKRTSPGEKPWLHLKTRLRESSALRLVLKGDCELHSCAFSPDGKTVASASWDKTVRLWDVRTGKEKAVLSGHTSGVSSCAFSPDGKMVASAGLDETVRLWDAQMGKIIYIYPCIGTVIDSSFSPLGKMTAVGDTGGNVYILELIGFDAKK